MTIRYLDCRINEVVFSFFSRDLTDFVFYSGSQKMIASFPGGRVEFYNIENLPLGPLITTAHCEIISEDLPAGPVTARPPCCGKLISIPPAIVDRIEHWSYEGGEGGYTDPSLLLDCPNCKTPLRMNPFFVDISTTASEKL
jgi:hypothetical protein